MCIKDVIYRVVHAYPGGVPALAARMGISKHVLQNKVNPNNDTHHLTVAELIEIQGFTGSDEIAKHIAGERNLICIPISKHQGASDMELLDLIITLEKEKADWLVSIQRALSDGVIDPLESERIKQESNEHLAAVLEMVNRIEGMEVDRRKVARAG
jgi:hypothetical protein